MTYRILVYISLHSLLCIPHVLKANTPDQSYNSIDSEILKRVDGKPFVLEKIIHLEALRLKVHAILSCTVTDHCTFKDLIGLESTLTSAKRDAILQKFIKKFTSVSKKHIDALFASNVPGLPDIIADFVQAWSLKTNRSARLISLLITKDNRKDYATHLNKSDEIMIAHIKTLAEFDALLEDLHAFLWDTARNLQKSFHLYQEMKKMNEERHEHTTQN